MAVFRCTKQDGTWDDVDAPYECLADLHEALSTTGMVLGEILWTTRTTERGVRCVGRRTPTIMTPRAYVQISDCVVRFIEETD